jgi:hypothetical protein
VWEETIGTARKKVDTKGSGSEISTNFFGFCVRFMKETDYICLRNYGICFKYPGKGSFRPILMIFTQNESRFVECADYEYEGQSQTNMFFVVFVDQVAYCVRAPVTRYIRETSYFLSDHLMIFADIYCYRFSSIVGIGTCPDKTQCLQENYDQNAVLKMYPANLACLLAINSCRP